MRRLALIVATALCLFGCRKEQTKDPLVGRWVCEDSEIYIDGELTEGKARVLAWVFNDDGTGGLEMTGNYGEYFKPFEWVTDNEKIGITYPDAKEYDVQEEIYDIIYRQGVWMQIRQEYEMMSVGVMRKVSVIYYITKTE